MTRQYARLASVGLLVAFLGCNDALTRPAGSPSSQTAYPAQQSAEAAGGCGPTHVYLGPSPPTWAQAGFRVQQGQAWTLPWARGESGAAIGYLFAIELVAKGDRPDGISNKVLWVTRDVASQIRISAHPAHQAEPVVAIGGQITNANQMPSQVDLPSPGCWSFELSWGQGLTKKDRISLQVLPAGTAPPPH